MQNSNDVVQIEVSIEELKAKIKAGDELDKLHRSPAFKQIISKDYFEKKAQNLVSMSGLPQNEMQKELLNNSMIGISALQSYFRSIYKDADEAKASLEAYEAELTEAQANG